MHLRAGPDEDVVLQALVKEVQEQDLLVKDSSRDLKDLQIGFHEERNTLKQQVDSEVINFSTGIKCIFFRFLKGLRCVLAIKVLIVGPVCSRL